MKCEGVTLTTLKGMAHRWKKAEGFMASRKHFTSHCGLFVHDDFLQPPMDDDRRCRRCFPERPKERDV